MFLPNRTNVSQLLSEGDSDQTETSSLFSVFVFKNEFKGLCVSSVPQLTLERNIDAKHLI